VDGAQPSEKTGGVDKHLGNTTECALLSFVTVLGRDYNKYRLDTPDKALHKIYTFNSSRKSMSTVVRIDKGFRLYCKGASEIVLTKLVDVTVSLHLI
jgi:P-type Ca2+ transporter type 2B